MNIRNRKSRSVSISKKTSIDQKLMSTGMAMGLISKRTIDCSQFKPVSPYTKLQSKTFNQVNFSVHSNVASKNPKKTLNTEYSDSKALTEERKFEFPKLQLDTKESPIRKRVLGSLNMKPSTLSITQTKDLFQSPTKDTKAKIRINMNSTRYFAQTETSLYQIANTSVTKSPYRIRWFDTAANFTSLDSYLRIGKVIGEGAFAKVYEAADLATGDRVAVKMFDKRLLSDSTARKSLQNEIDLLSKLDHPAIVRLRRVSEDHKSICLILDHWGEYTLKEWLDKKGWTSEAQTAVNEVGRALTYMHSRRIYHRDIKLTNIMVQGGRGCLLDFGMAVESTSEKDYLYCGTSNYLSPEMVQRSGYLLGPNDVWAFAVTLFRSSTGIYPFGGS